MHLVLVGLNHKTAPLDLRDRLVYDRRDALAALRRLRNSRELPQCLLLSTCNRTEVYALGRDAEEVAARVREVVFASRVEAAPEMLYRRQGKAAATHLFRVACGLDSLVLGEQQILGQVKQAYQLSHDAESAGSVLHRLIQGAFRAAKQSRTQTRIGAGAVSVASVAVELAEKVYQSLEGKHALLVGAGENGEQCARHLLARDIASLTITNRTLAKAEALAASLGGDAASFDELGDALVRADIVVSTTGASEPIIDARLMKRAMRARGHAAMVIVDIAVPRDVAAEVDSLANVFLFDMDALSQVANANYERRRTEIPKVEALIEHEVDVFCRWWGSLDAGPVIRDLHQSFEEIRAFEIEKNAKRFLNEDRKQLDLFSRNLVRKLLMGVTQEIKSYSRDDPVEMERLATLRDVFHLTRDDESGND
jgi:glutamyl-tRNA reductase